MPPRKITTAGDQVSFGPTGTLVFRLLEEKANYLGRINKDGTGRERISRDPILNKGYVSPGGDWTMALVSGIDGGTSVESVALPLTGGPPRLICALTCPAGWSPDGRVFFVGTGTATGVDMGKLLTFPIPAGSTHPNLPETGVVVPRDSNPEPANLVGVSPGPGFASYAFSKADIQRNLFRIPLR